MDNTKNIQTLIFLKPLNETLSEVKEVIEQNEEIQIFSIESSAQLNAIIKKSGPSVFIASNPKLCAQVLKTSKNVIKGSTSKVILLSPKKFPYKTLEKFNKIGLTECLVEPIPTKTVLYKINLMLKSLSKKKEAQVYNRKTFEKNNNEKEADKKVSSTLKKDEEKNIKIKSLQKEDQQDITVEDNSNYLKSSNMEGKTSTDHEAGNMEGKTSTDHKAGNMQGKSSTDHKTGNLKGKTSSESIETHYQGNVTEKNPSVSKNEPDQKKKQLKPKEYKDDEGIPLNSPQSGPLKGNISAVEEKEEDRSNTSNKVSLATNNDNKANAMAKPQEAPKKKVQLTDHIEGHYKGEFSTENKEEPTLKKNKYHEHSKEKLKGPEKQNVVSDQSKSDSKKNPNNNEKNKTSDKKQNIENKKKSKLIANQASQKQTAKATDENLKTIGPRIEREKTANKPTPPKKTSALRNRSENESNEDLEPKSKLRHEAKNTKAIRNKKKLILEDDEGSVQAKSSSIKKESKNSPLRTQDSTETTKESQYSAHTDKLKKHYSNKSQYKHKEHKWNSTRIQKDIVKQKKGTNLNTQKDNLSKSNKSVEFKEMSTQALEDIFKDVPPKEIEALTSESEVTKKAASTHLKVTEKSFFQSTGTKITADVERLKETHAGHSEQDTLVPLEVDSSFVFNLIELQRLYSDKSVHHMVIIKRLEAIIEKDLNGSLDFFEANKNSFLINNPTILELSQKSLYQWSKVSEPSISDITVDKTNHTNKTSYIFPYTNNNKKLGFAVVIFDKVPKKIHQVESYLYLLNGLLSSMDFKTQEKKAS